MQLDSLLSWELDKASAYAKAGHRNVPVYENAGVTIAVDRSGRVVVSLAGEARLQASMWEEACRVRSRKNMTSIERWPGRFITFTFFAR